MLSAKLLILMCIAFLADAQYRRPPPPRPYPGRPNRPLADPIVVEPESNPISSEPTVEVANEEINTTPAPIIPNPSAPTNYPRPDPRPLPPNRPSYRPNRPFPSRPNRPGASPLGPLTNPSDEKPETPSVVIVYPEKPNEVASSDPNNNVPPSHPPTEEYVPEPTFSNPQPEEEDYSEFYPTYFNPDEEQGPEFDYELVSDPEYGPLYPQPELPFYTPEENPQPETQPEYQPESRPEYQPETQPEYQPETQPEYQPETQPEYQPETQPEYEPETQPEYQPETQPEYQPETQPEYQPETQPEYQPETQPEYQPETQPEYQPEVRPEYQPEPVPEPSPVGETEPELLPQSEPEIHLDPELIPIFNPHPYPTEPSHVRPLIYPEEPDTTTYYPLIDMDGDEPPKRDEDNSDHKTPYLPSTTEVYPLPPINFTSRPFFTPRPFYTPRTTPKLHTNPTPRPTPRPSPTPTPIPSPTPPEIVPPTFGPVNVIPLRPTRPTVSPFRPSSPIQSQPIIDYPCRDPDAYYSIANECDTFIQCRQGVARKYICPDGLLFNPKAFWPQYPCVYPSQVRCSNKTITQKPKPNGECPRRYGNFPARTGGCGQYIVCHDGHATLMRCPQGLVFNLRSGACDWPEKVPSCRSNVFDGFRCPAPVRDDYGRISDRVDNFRYRTSCKEYIACLKGEPRLLRCDPGLSFDEITGRCIHSDAVMNCDP